MNTNVTIQDLLTALLYWRGKAKELEAALRGVLEIDYRIERCDRPVCETCFDTKTRLDAARAALGE